MAPVILRGGKLLTFQNLVDPANPFADVVAVGSVERHDCQEWWDDPDRMKWFIDLTNRALNKLTGRRKLSYDNRHHRYFFQPAGPNRELEIEYRPLNQKKATRSVVWQPRNKRTGEKRGSWYHRAVSLRFLRTGATSWCLGIRPELHVTSDGVHPLSSDQVGSRVTKKKSRMFNYDLLGEVQFWRDYLSGSSPRIVFHFGPYPCEYPTQHLVVSTGMLSGSVTWPGIPEEHEKPFRNVEYVDDLFSWAEMAQVDAQDGDDDWDILAQDETWESERQTDDIGSE